MIFGGKPASRSAELLVQCCPATARRPEPLSFSNKPSPEHIDSPKPHLSQGRGGTQAGAGTRSVPVKYSKMSPKGNLCPKIVARFPWLGRGPRQTHSAAPHDFLLCLQDRQPPASRLKAHLHGRGFLHFSACEHTAAPPQTLP